MQNAGRPECATLAQYAAVCELHQCENEISKSAPHCHHPGRCKRSHSGNNESEQNAHDAGMAAFSHHRHCISHNHQLFSDPQCNPAVVAFCRHVSNTQCCNCFGTWHPAYAQPAPCMKGNTLPVGPTAAAAEHLRTKTSPCWPHTLNQHYCCCCYRSNILFVSCRCCACWCCLLCWWVWQGQCWLEDACWVSVSVQMVQDQQSGPSRYPSI